MPGTLIAVAVALLVVVAVVLARRGAPEPQTAEECIELAERAFEGMQFEKAEGLIRRAVEFAPREAEVHFTLGMCLAMQERMGEAMDEFRTAIECDSKHADAWYALGNGYEQEGKLEDAKRHFERALELEPGNEDTQQRLEALRQKIGH